MMLRRRMAARLRAKFEIPRVKCRNCGHAAYHCIASGCNHIGPDGEWCECEDPVPVPIHFPAAATGTAGGGK